MGCTKIKHGSLVSVKTHLKIWRVSCEFLVTCLVLFVIIKVPLTKNCNSLSRVSKILISINSITLGRLFKGWITLLSLIHWIVIYPVDSAVHPLNSNGCFIEFYFIMAYLLIRVPCNLLGFICLGQHTVD